VDVMRGCPLPIEVGTVRRVCGHSRLPGENVFDLSSKNAGFMRFVAKKLLVVRNRDWGDLIDPWGLRL